MVHSLFETCNQTVFFQTSAINSEFSSPPAFKSAVQSWIRKVMCSPNLVLVGAGKVLIWKWFSYRIWQKHFKICWKFFIPLIGQKYFPISTFLYLNKIWLKKLLIFSWCCLKFCHYNSIKCNFNLIIANFNYFRVAWIFSIYNANSFWIQANSTKTLCFNAS